MARRSCDGRSPRDSKANSYFMATHSPPPLRFSPLYTSNIFISSVHYSKSLFNTSSTTVVVPLLQSSNIFISFVYYSRFLFTAIQIKDLKDYHSANIFISSVYHRKSSFNTSSTTTVVPLLQSSNIFISSVHYSKPLFTAIQICDLKDYPTGEGSLVRTS